jgi:methylmalonyl-CoA mutase cobalamin-binding subunit
MRTRSASRSPRARHMTLVPRILALLKEQGAEDLLVVVGWQ